MKKTKVAGKGEEKGENNTRINTKRMSHLTNDWIILTLMTLWEIMGWKRDFCAKLWVDDFVWNYGLVILCKIMGWWFCVKLWVGDFVWNYGLPQNNPNTQNPKKMTQNPKPTRGYIPKLIPQQTPSKLKNHPKVRVFVSQSIYVLHVSLQSVYVVSSDWDFGTLRCMIHSKTAWNVHALNVNPFKKTLKEPS